MAVQLNHTIVAAPDAEEAATFAAEILGLAKPTRFAPFVVLQIDNGVSLDYLDHDGDITAQHYAFLVSEADFDAIFGRILQRGVRHWADPMRSRPGEINHHDGGRGVYFEDPAGHLLEIITRPYGSGG
jgi:catechol 2,3-dioxygenase-like lactoylglutathione lyase family enzyme